MFFFIFFRLKPNQLNWHMTWNVTKRVSRVSRTKRLWDWRTQRCRIYRVFQNDQQKALPFFTVLNYSALVTFLDFLLGHLIFCIICKPLVIALRSNMVFVRNVSIGLWGQNLKRKKVTKHKGIVKLTHQELILAYKAQYS